MDYFDQALTHFRYEGKAYHGKNVKAVKQAIAGLIDILRKHRKFQEEIIFPYLLIHIPKHEAVIQFLRLDHESIRKNKEKLYRLLKNLSQKTIPVLDGKIRELGIYLTHLIRHHIELERGSIHKAVKHELKRDEKMDVEKIARNWFKQQANEHVLVRK